MTTTDIKQDSTVSYKYNSYALSVRPKLEQLRVLINVAATETENIKTLEGALKWGESGYKVKKGSQ